MKTGIAWMRGGVALAALFAGLAAAQAGSLKIESWRNDDADIWNNKIIPAFNKHYPDIKVEFSATQRRRNTTPRSTPSSTAAPPATSSPAGRSTPRSQLYQEAPARRPQRPQGHGQLLRRRQGRLVDRRRQDDLLRADGLGHPRLHLQRGRLQEDRRRSRRRRWPSSTTSSTSSRRTGPTRRSTWAPPTSGRPRPWASRTSARTTGRARPAARR